MRLRAAILFLAMAAACGGKPEQPVVKPENIPGVPQNVKLVRATETSLTFQWSAVSGASGYGWKLSLDGEVVKNGTSSARNVEVKDLAPGTTYGFCVCAKGTAESDYCAVIEAKTEGTVPTPPDPSVKTQCVDAPIVIEYASVPTLGNSGLIRVLKADGTVVDRIDMADMATVDILEDGTMVPKGADADAGKIAINNDYKFNTFMDALHSGQYRMVHYTPVRVNGKTLEIKLHNEALSFGETYTVKVDASVAGMVAEDVTFTTKPRPSSSAVIKVAADGSGDFCTLQGALSYVSANVGKDNAVTIEMAAGTYREMLFLRNKNNVTIKGVNREGTVIAYPNNDSYETGSGASVGSKPSLGSSIGKSGGRCVFLVESCDNLVLEDLTIENTYSIPSHKGQAETIYFNSAHRMTIKNCALISWQDTFLTKGKVWVYRTLIAGHVDYIWGYPEACLFEECEIRSRAGGYIVQARIQSASNPGFVFLNCNLTAESGVASGSMYLARSGGDTSVYDNVVFVNCTMGPVIAPAGWFGPSVNSGAKKPTPEAPTASSGWREYGSVKPDGTSASGSRNAYGLVLTASEAAPYSSKAAVLGW